ncbi:MAG: 3-deoxy-D-manno-octulosonic acid transferase [Alphaproteobacteria bacterium]|nr:3-deoxy-D-manno-octulosonic acid transferase [Alphaproteobacteria bacterium]
MASRSSALVAYRLLSAAASPAVSLFLRRRTAIGKEKAGRKAERFGRARIARPSGTLIWIHGASVGECIAALPLIERLVSGGKFKVLITSGTVASAELMQLRLPEGAVHQFVPVDTPTATARFLSHWRPDLCIFIDSDLWPNLVRATRAAGTKMILANARMSEASFRRWRWAPRFAQSVLSSFDLCLAQSEEFAARFRHLGCPSVRVAGSLKADAPPLSAEPGKLAQLRDAIGMRPVLVAAQTHSGEDETILPAHDFLREKLPDLLTVIVPRHVERGDDIVALCGTRSVRQRSRGEIPEKSSSVYVADTMNELGLFYRLGRVAFVGGTLVPVGGHNPLEPAKLECPVLAGPHIANSRTAFEAIFAAQGMGPVSTARDIARCTEPILSNPSESARLGKAAALGAAGLGGAVASTFAAVEALLSDAQP